MLLARQVFQAKYGRGDELVALFQEMNTRMQEEGGDVPRFRILTDASSNGNVKLRDIAASLVQSVGGTAIQTHFEEPGRKEAV